MTPQEFLQIAKTRGVRLVASNVTNMEKATSLLKKADKWAIVKALPLRAMDHRRIQWWHDLDTNYVHTRRRNLSEVYRVVSGFILLKTPTGKVEVYLPN